MGRSGSSSKRKSSKKKSLKTSSEVLRRKRSKRNKSKKLRRRDDSSFYSDDESASSVSISHTSSEDDYKSRKGRSRLRNNVKSSRKRARRSSSNRESSKDSPRLRKRKRSKKNGDSELRKKSQKKKPRRDASSSPRSSDSRICSNYRSGSTSSGVGSEFERLRGRSIENKKGKRDSSKARSGTKKSKNRSRSGDSNGNHGKENVAVEINLRRLKSVITVTKEPREEQENERYKDEHTEEIVYDHDDYPSCRSNDSNDGGSKRELVHQSHVESEKRIRLENVMGEEAFVSNLSTNEPIVSDKDDDGQYDGLIPCSDRVGTNSPEKENGSDNMESILRQKALENLRRFQGGRQTNAKTSIDQENKSVINVKKLSTANAVCVESKSPKQDASTVVGATQLVDHNLRPKLRRDSSRPIRTEGKILAGRYSGTESGTANQCGVCPPDGAVFPGILKGKDDPTPHAVSNKSESSISAVRQESLITGSTLKQAPMSQASPKATLLVTKTILNKNSAETSQTVAASGSNNQSLVGVIDASGSAPSEPSSCVKPTSEEHSSREQQDEVKDSSQFEQKTMSVMRGGEMVQVNYKVYIPKKAPALARRKLQR